MPEDLGPSLVTGATGFIGRHLVQALLSQNRKVIALGRQIDSLRGLKDRQLQIIPGDIRDEDSYRHYLGPETTVFHLAGIRRSARASRESLFQVNVQATRNLGVVCLEKGIKKLLYVSSALVYGPSQGQPTSEREQLFSHAAFDLYYHSRVSGLLEMRRLASEGLPLVTVCPTIVYGPDEPSHRNRITNQIRRLVRFKIDLLLGKGDGLRDLVCVEDVVQGILLAEERAQISEEFILGGESTSQRQLSDLVFKLIGCKPRLRLSLPMKLVGALARVYETLRRREESSFSHAFIKNLEFEWEFSSNKSKSLLGYCATPLEEALGRTLQFLQQGAP